MWLLTSSAASPQPTSANGAKARANERPNFTQIFMVSSFEANATGGARGMPFDMWVRVAARCATAVVCSATFSLIGSFANAPRGDSSSNQGQLGCVECWHGFCFDNGQTRAKRVTKDPAMLYWAAVFFVIALLAAVFGFGGIAASAVGVAKVLFFVFLILAVVSLIFGRRVPT
jgi:uncharacterized membrane protein YtjA (UPF0391 family)